MKALQLFNPNVQGFEWYKHLLSLKFSKQIAKRATGLGNEEIDHERAESVLLDSDQSYSALVVRTSAASQVEPWLLIIERLKLDERVSIRNVHLRNEGLSSSKGPNGYFLLPDPQSDSAKVLFSYLFTGNPFLYLPSQPSALVSVLWVRVIEELLIAFRRKRFMRDKLLNVAQDVLNLTRFIAEAQVPNRLFKLSEEDLVNSNDWRAAIVSEKEGVLSLSIVLVALAQNTNSLKDEGFYQTVAMCLLQESVMRSAEAVALSHGANFSRTDFLASILGISSSKTEWQFNAHDCVERTRKFFKLRNNNCTPFAVVAVLGFWVSGCQDAAALLALYETSKISMKTFIKSVNEQVDPLAVQVAMFLNGFAPDEGVDYCAAFKHPNEVIDLHAAKIMQTFAKREAAELQRKAVSKEHFLNKLKAFGEHAKWHEGDPLIFRQSQIAEMNMSRPADNQLELADGYSEFGLLKYHCCHPKCPHFLGKAFCNRKELFKHLDPDQRYYINYVPSYHLTIHAIFKQHKNTNAEQFRQYLRKAVSNDRRMNEWFKNCPEEDNSDAGLDLIFQQYRSLQ